MKIELQGLSGYMHDSDYPPLKVISGNDYYAEILLEDYAGVDSECTAIMQYSYHQNVNRLVDEDVVDHLGKIILVEAMHRDILAQVIYMLGTYPVYRSGTMSDRGYWSTKHVGYGRGLKEQLQNDLDMEYRSIKNYNTHIRLINDPYIKAILARIVKDEEVHVKWIQYMLEQYL